MCIWALIYGNKAIAVHNNAPKEHRPVNDRKHDDDKAPKRNVNE